MPSGKAQPRAKTAVSGDRPNLGYAFAGLADHATYFAQALSYSFEGLRVAAALHDSNEEWHAIHNEPGVATFEYAHGRGLERAHYNAQCLRGARQTQRIVLGTHAGFSDFFAPVVREGCVDAVLITGTFATARPTSDEILARWRWLTGRQGDLADPQFAKYVTMTLETLTLEGGRVSAFERWLACLTALMAGSGNARELALEAAKLNLELDSARRAERMWRAVREMVDESQRRVWHSPQMGDDLLRIGLDRPPEQLLVGLLGPGNAANDAVRELLRADAFQRACVDLVAGTPCAVGRVGESGVVFLANYRASGARLERALAELAHRASLLARRKFGSSLHVGLGTSEGELGERYARALAAAERALADGASWIVADRARDASNSTRELRHSLKTLAEAQPRALIARFERYIQAVTVEARQRIDVARAELAAGFDQAAQALLDSGILNPAHYRDACDALDRAAREAQTMNELVASHRRAVVDLVALAERPVESAQQRGLRRALRFIGEHVTGDVSLSRAARAAGFAPSYFSALFKRRQGVTFERYVLGLRIERAKELLAATDFPAERVARLSGFRLRHYFHRAFKEAVRMTPLQYRNSRYDSRRRPRPQAAHRRNG